MVLLIVALAWVGGVLWGVAWLTEGMGPEALRLPLLLLGGASLAALALGWTSSYLRLPALTAIAISAGIYWGALRSPALQVDQLRPYVGIANLEGRVAAPPDARETFTYVRLEVQRAHKDGPWAEVNGTVLLRVSTGSTLLYGDVIQARGQLREVSALHGLPYQQSWRRQGLKETMDFPQVTILEQGEAPSGLAALHRLRAELERGLRSVLPEPHGSLMAGLLLGTQGGMPADFRRDLVASGMSHAVAVSGFNITVVAGLVAAVTRRLWGARAALPIAMGALWIYTLLTGAPPSALRAAIMASAALAALAFGRASDPLTSLAVAAALMVGWDPTILWDIGFQLSFLSTAGLITVQPALATPFKPLPAGLSETAAVTLAAQVATVPLVLLNFRTLSVIAPLTNLLLVPAIPLLMALGAVAAAAAWLAPAIAGIAALPAWLGLAYMVDVVRLSAALPWSVVYTGSLGQGAAVAYYVVLLGFVVWRMPEGRGFREFLGSAMASKAIKYGLVAILPLALLAWVLATSRPDGKLHVYFLDVGQGDATLIRSPSGRLLLVDGGPSPLVLDARMGDKLAFWERNLDVVLLTHPHEDHLAGLPQAAERRGMGLVLQPPIDAPTGPASRWLETIRRKGIPLVEAKSPHSLDLGDGARLEASTVEVEDRESGGTLRKELWMLARIAFGETSVLLPGDLTAEGLRRALATMANPRSDVLLVPHHGSRTGLDAATLAMVAPKVAVISVGERNRFGHPTRETLELLRGIPLYRTDLHGTVEVVSDGLSLEVVGSPRSR